MSYTKKQLEQMLKEYKKYDALISKLQARSPKKKIPKKSKMKLHKLFSKGKLEKLMQCVSPFQYSQMYEQYMMMGGVHVGGVPVGGKGQRGPINHQYSIWPTSGLYGQDPFSLGGYAGAYTGGAYSGGVPVGGMQMPMYGGQIPTYQDKFGAFRGGDAMQDPYGADTVYGYQQTTGKAGKAKLTSWQKYMKKIKRCPDYEAVIADYEGAGKKKKKRKVNDFLKKASKLKEGKVMVYKGSSYTRKDGKIKKLSK